jgi:hypothetical protein
LLLPIDAKFLDSLVVAVHVLQANTTAIVACKPLANNAKLVLSRAQKALRRANGAQRVLLPSIREHLLACNAPKDYSQHREARLASAQRISMEHTANGFAILQQPVVVEVIAGEKAFAFV